MLDTQTTAKMVVRISKVFMMYLLTDLMSSPFEGIIMKIRLSKNIAQTKVWKAIIRHRK